MRIETSLSSLLTMFNGSSPAATQVRCPVPLWNYYRARGCTHGAPPPKRLDIWPGRCEFWRGDEFEQANSELIADAAPGFYGFGTDGAGHIFAIAPYGAVVALPEIGTSPDRAHVLARDWQGFEQLIPDWVELPKVAAKMPGWVPAWDQPVAAAADAYRAGTRGEHDFALLAHGTCVQLPQGLPEPWATREAIERIKADYGRSGGGLKAWRDRSGDVFLTQGFDSHNVALLGPTQENWGVVFANHLDALLPGEVIDIGLGPNIFDPTHIAALYARCCFFMDAARPRVLEIRRRDALPSLLTLRDVRKERHLVTARSEDQRKVVEAFFDDLRSRIDAVVDKGAHTVSMQVEVARHDSVGQALEVGRWWKPEASIEASTHRSFCEWDGFRSWAASRGLRAWWSTRAQHDLKRSGHFSLNVESRRSPDA